MYQFNLVPVTIYAQSCKKLSEHVSFVAYTNQFKCISPKLPCSRVEWKQILPLSGKSGEVVSERLLGKSK